jgi:cytochrome P450
VILIHKSCGELLYLPKTEMVIELSVKLHVAFGFGIHRCMWNHLVEVQLRIVWEEIMKRFRMIEVVGEPERTFSTFAKGFTKLPVKVHDW